ncbi:ATP-binding protein [Streptomyces sp. NPDC005374]|uniref:ATP-binding protein n=1 Tax=Streptomyces sp. NPDC005374 TaxID=3364713 RepID=UPI003683760B
MNQEVLIWCLASVAATAVAAVVVLTVRSRALGARKRQAETDLARQRVDAQLQVEAARAELVKFRQEQDDVIFEAERTAEDRTRGVLKGAARFLQGLAAEQTKVLDTMQLKYGGHAVLSDLLEVHHANAQMARKAEGIAVLCGGPLGRRNKPASVYDVVRSAQSQIRNFQRVEIMQVNGIALKASAVAPVALTVAELLDNAASFSQQDAPIEVTFKRVQNNVCIVIDDAGVSMSDEDRQAATELLSGETTPRLSQLGNQPKFGFPVIGLLARQYGFSVDVTGVSRYGGVRAVVLLPEELWTMEETPPPANDTPVSSIRRDEGKPRTAARTAHGLPKRGARQTPIASVTDGGDRRSESRVRDVTAARGSGRGLGGLQRGTLSGRESEVASLEGSLDGSREGSEDV